VRGAGQSLCLRPLAKCPHAESDRFVILTAIELLAFAVGVAGGISFFFYALPSGNAAEMIIALAVVIIFATVGVAAHMLARLPPTAATPVSSSQRGYVQISGFVVAIGATKTSVFYRLTVDGPTYIDIESGEIRLSIDDPPLSISDRNAGLYTAKITAQRIVPRQQGLQTAELAALPKEHQAILLSGKPIKIFYAGEIYYRDAFNGTPRHRRIFAYSVYGNTTEPLDMSILTRNEETDEDTGK
jgi:hypothetical protein